MPQLPPETVLMLAAGYVCHGDKAPTAAQIDNLRAAVAGTSYGSLTTRANAVRAAAAMVVQCPAAARPGWIECLDKALSCWLAMETTLDRVPYATDRAEDWRRFKARCEATADPAAIDRWRNRADLQ